MNCEPFRERLLDWLDGAGDADLDRHLEACAECRGFFDQARSTAATLSADKRSEVAGDWAGLVRRRRPRWKWITATAAAAAVIAALFVVTRREEPRPKRLRIEVVDATSRVEPSQVEALFESFEDR